MPAVEHRCVGRNFHDRAPSRPALAALTYAPGDGRLYKAHLMTGSAMGSDASVAHSPPLLFDVAFDPAERFPLDGTYILYKDPSSIIYISLREALLLTPKSSSPAQGSPGGPHAAALGEIARAAAAHLRTQKWEHGEGKLLNCSCLLLNCSCSLLKCSC